MNEKSLHELCVAAAVSFMRDGMKRHISYISPEDLPQNGPFLKSGGRVPRITIEWVDESETMPIVTTE